MARKKLGGRDVVYGKEAVDNRLAVNLVRPLAEGTFKMVGEDSDAGKKAVRDLLQYAVSMSQVPAGSTIYAAIGIR